MQKDIRQIPLYGEAEALYATLRQPGTGQISDAAEVHACSDGRRVAFTATIMDKLEGSPPTRICSTDLQSGETRVLTFGAHTDRSPKFSPDGRCIAFLSDRSRVGDFQLYLLDPESGAARGTVPVAGWIEYLHWSPDGNRILLGVAGHGADIAGGQGAVASKQSAASVPSWMPKVELRDAEYRWRRAWVYDVASKSVSPVSKPDCNVWEAVWCGNDRLAVVASAGASEGLWYTARLYLLDIHTGATREVYAPEWQVGWPAANRSGTALAIVEAVCSDRWIVAGDLRLIETASGRVRRVDTGGMSITTAEWRSDRTLLLAGLRGFETVVGLYDLEADRYREVWRSIEVTTAGHYINVSGFGAEGDCALIGESFVRAPEIAVIRGGQYSAVKSFDLGYAQQVGDVAAVEQLAWRAPDGLEIQGWLLRPKRHRAPHPLILYVHGGPVSNSRPVWLVRPRGAPVLMLLKRGYAVFYPNPRGSSGRGQSFARHVLGDMGGADTQDYLCGLDHLTGSGTADAAKLGVMGVSYGGYMTCWLITQDPRFAAAVAVAPIGNHVTEHLISNIPDFVKLFLADHYTNPGGKYFQRSPIMHAHKARTPTLNVCGALDRCTPPEEALQFHNALLENGVESVLVTYPEEGHGVRKFPAAIDYAARVVAWFERHIPV